MRYQGQPSFRGASCRPQRGSQTPAGLFQKSTASTGLQPCGISIAFLRLPPGALQRVAELFFAAAAKPSQYIFAAPNKLGIDCLDIDHETFVNPAKPYHDQRRQEVERHPLRSAEIHSRRTREAKLDNPRFPIICF